MTRMPIWPRILAGAAVRRSAGELPATAQAYTQTLREQLGGEPLPTASLEPLLRLLPKLCAVSRIMPVCLL